MSTVLHDVTAGKGIAVGHAHLITRDTAEVPQYNVSDGLIDAETARFDAAIKATHKELEQLRSAIPENAPTELGAFISLHLMLLTNVTLSREPVNISKERRVSVEWALRQWSDKLVAQFNNIEDDYLHERKQDILQVVRRIHSNLIGQSNDLNLDDGLFEDTILIAHDLSPADTVLFKEQKTTAFVTDTDGSTNHTVILGRSLDIPSIIDLHNARKPITENETIVVGGINGVLIIEPDEVVLDEYYRLAREYCNHKREPNRLKKTAATTADGVSIELLANIESAEDIEALHNFNADSVGLSRSGFLYLSRNTISSENKQHEVYSAIVKKMKGKGITFRAIDLGVDKNPRWFDRNTTSNGSLNSTFGLTGIRLCFTEPVILRTQVRAIPRAVVHGTVHMIWSMITPVSGVRRCLIHLDTIQRQLTERGEAFDAANVGYMIEIPSTATTINSILKLIDFISIGANGLIQYVLSVDRGDDSVSHLYQPDHPAVLETIQYIIYTADCVKKSVSICDGMAGDTAFTYILSSTELCRLSMDPNNLLAVKNIVLHSDTERLRHETAKLLRNDDPEKSGKLLGALNSISVTVETAW